MTTSTKVKTYCKKAQTDQLFLESSLGINVEKITSTVKSTDPTIVARATTYSGKVERIVQVVSEEALAAYAEHCNLYMLPLRDERNNPS